MLLALGFLSIAGIKPFLATKSFHTKDYQKHLKHGAVNHLLANQLWFRWSKALVTYSNTLDSCQH
jgi:hypothetical protein